MTKFDSVKKFAKETGEKIIGRGPEVRFRNEVGEYAKNNGTTPEVAQKIIFDNYLRNMRDEARLKGSIDYSSREWRDFEAAMNECFDGTDKARFQEDADDSSIYRRMPTAPTTPSAYSRSKNYYKGKYDGKDPGHAVVMDTAQTTHLIEALGNRFSGDLGPLLGSPDTIKDLMATNPELGADLGKLLQSKGLLEKHESKFKRQLNFEHSIDKFKGDTKDAIINIFGKGLLRWAKVMGKSAIRPSMGNIMKMTGETLRLMGLTVGAGLKIGASAGRTTLSGLNKLRG